MSVLAHVLEAAGLSTVVFASVREVAAKVAPPRALFCEFPLGRPLGRPGDAAFQRDVLQRGLGLLAADSPVLADHPDVIETNEMPMACAMPPRYDPDVPAAVDEARAIRAAYDRSLATTGSTSVGRAIDPDGIADALAVLDAWATGTPWTDLALPGKNTVAVCHDIRTYYEEAALELVTGPDSGDGSAEAWFFDTTAAGATMLAARAALKDQDAPFPFWFYMAPGHR